MGITTWLFATCRSEYSIDKENGDQIADFGVNRGSGMAVVNTMLNIGDLFSTQLRERKPRWRNDDPEEFYAGPVPKLLTLDDAWWSDLVRDETGRPVEWSGGETCRRCDGAWHVRALIGMLAAWRKKHGEVMLCWRWY